MLKRSVYALRYALVVLVASTALYLFFPKVGIYFLGIALISMALATVLYILFMFRRYGEKKPIE